MKFSHIEDGRAKMVDISEKHDIFRYATATGEIQLRPETIAAIKNMEIQKGAVLETARIASVIAIKNTSSVIPMCHQIPITGIDVQFDLGMGKVKVTVEVKSIGKTGVEMEALHGVSVALLTIWDMVKSVEKDETGNYPSTRIKNILVLEKIKQEIE
ncbi:MAG: GTP cyclohydrolase subunit MoaC [Candidatus Methanoperedens nitroreducens]|uniref:Probable cyclic pyranopterin monophosphate synthase n=1 Tax=Candidatus Methanoperedens nitratireducens TaxID=1392998 RepID=A0A0P8E441_9EURY|nr:cyclic pyranopterin monophosphate synthase MoaC [Candidatus Methanoperedens sp. BLZ2]KAB2945506.1 MAG: cyclic pyranopterin monophosphate synthase MoaC [Candidatus Methanoperedens sp.]KPQ45375.1 MAG: GTP cyclohydrolase subunit MoaC [Candidatus Methanoperedens sp. BLZ1]MBZ0174755.1 cyclic pyranopterin monophosphate synthase MoaC [Candidatus Methanoperedens nitroreducens]MCX9080100.1 cyclic pyranopterin monophosphate synthase MoaC [Candidatus Methanoperedens sp.]